MKKHRNYAFVHSTKMIKFDVQAVNAAIFLVDECLLYDSELPNIISLGKDNKKKYLKQNQRLTVHLLSFEMHFNIT